MAKEQMTRQEIIDHGDTYNTIGDPHKQPTSWQKVLKPKNTMRKVHQATIINNADPNQYYFTYFYFFGGAIMEFQDNGDGFVLSLEEFYMEMDRIGLCDLERETVWEQVLELADAYTELADDMVAEITPLENQDGE